MTNQERVWKEEKLALEERKRIDQMMKERQEERAIQELQELQEAAGGKKRLNRVEWMYSGPASGQAATTEEMEGYLLGKRRIDGLLKGTENKKLEKSASQDTFMALQNANTLRDTASKVREDPMLAIKKQEQAAYEALMNDPTRRRLLLKAVNGDAKSRNREHGRRKHRHHETGAHQHRSHIRRRADRDYGKARAHRSSNYQYSSASSVSRSPTPDHDRSPSPHYSRRRSRYREHSTSYGERRQRSISCGRSRSVSPHRRSRSRSPRTHRRDDMRPVRHSNSWHSKHQPSLHLGDGRIRPEGSDKGDGEARLAAMQEAATALDQDRGHRLRELQEMDRTECERDEAARKTSAKVGGQGYFVAGLRRKAGELELGERMRRGRGAYERAGVNGD